MEIHELRLQPSDIPKPHLSLMRWLSDPAHQAGVEGDAELRGSMFRRLEAIVASAVVTLTIVTLAVVHHPTAAFRFWFGIEVALFGVRVPLVLHLRAFMNGRNRSKTLNPWIVDLFIAAGTCWSAMLGFGCCISLLSNDAGLSILVSLLAMGTAGGQCARNLSSPRLNSVQMCLIMIPYSLGALLSSIPLAAWVLLLSPLFLAGMMNITYELHRDYVTVITARVENRRRAIHCSLTGLPNRAYFDEILRSTIESPAAAAETNAVLCLDLDGFKSVNDLYGHPIGDILLKQVAERLSGSTRSQDVAARIGGDEFAILLRSCHRQRAENVANRIIADLCRPFTLSTQCEVKIGVSIGIAFTMRAISADSTKDAAMLMANGDAALYTAKRGGRGTFKHFGVNAPGAVSDDSILVNKMRREELAEFV